MDRESESRNGPDDDVSGDKHVACPVNTLKSESNATSSLRRHVGANSSHKGSDSERKIKKSFTTIDLHRQLSKRQFMRKPKRIHVDSFFHDETISMSIEYNIKGEDQTFDI